MIQESGSEASAVRLLFGPLATVDRPRRHHVEIRRGGALLGEGSTFKQALQGALRTARTTGDVVKASELVPECGGFVVQTSPNRAGLDSSGPDSPRNARSAPRTSSEPSSTPDATGGTP